MSNGSMTPSAMRVIRLALFSGVLMFGGVAWYMTRESAVTPLPAEAATRLSWGFAVLALGSLAAVAAVRSAMARAVGVAQQATMAVVGWALGEAPALLGGVIYLLTGKPLAYLTGLAVLVAAMVMVQIPEGE